MDDLAPARAVGFALIAAALIANGLLLRGGYEPLTSLARTPGGRAFRRYFDLHCDGALGPLDAFSHLGRLVPRRIV